MEEKKKEIDKQKPVRKTIDKKKVLFIMLAVVISIIAIGGIVTAFMLNYNVSAPNNLRVIDDGRNIYVAVDMNDNYKSYKFVFIDTEDEESEIVIESDKNILTIDELQAQGIEIGHTYNITVTYIAENEGNNSEESKPITWTVYKNLSPAQLNYNQEEDIISWTAVDNADDYLLYISGLAPMQISGTHLDLQTIPGGEYSFYVVALSDAEYYENSLPSNELSIKVVHKYLPLLSVSFNAEEKLITATGYEQLEKFNIYLDDMVYECDTFEVSSNNGLYTYMIDISLLYQDNSVIGISPITLNEYNVYNGEVTYVQQ